MSGSGNQATFTFYNSGPIGSSICDIYFHDGTLLGIASISDSGVAVSFSRYANPPDLPGGQNIGFVTHAGFSADSDSPVSKMGVNNSGTEWVAITFNLINGKTFEDSLAALNSGELRVGLHVQSIAGAGSNNSDSFVNAVPEPSLVLLMGIGIGVVTLLGWRLKN